MSGHHRPQKLHFESMQAVRLTAARPYGLLEQRKKNVWLVQQGVWDMPQESMPLAIGMLKATDEFEFLKEIYDSTKKIERAMALKSIGDLELPEGEAFIAKVAGSKDVRDTMVADAVALYR